MTDFSEAIKNTETISYTKNGAQTLQSSLNANVDLFFMIGASRDKDITREFEKAFQEDSDIATRILLWARDVRGGAGERQTFRDLLQHLEKIHPATLTQLLPSIPALGRWDDLLHFKTKDMKEQAYALISHALLKEQNGLCAKWMPRQPTKTDTVAAELRNFMGLNPKQYRNMLVSLTNVVEQKMCAKEWDNIDFSKIPSVASARYIKAFEKNAQIQYQEYKEQLITGEAKINAGAIFPHNVLAAHRAGADSNVVIAQWDALPNYLGENNIIPMIDVSASMNTSIGRNKNLTCMDVSIAIGLYIADKQTGPFKDIALTFSTDTRIEILKGNVVEKMAQVAKMHWGGSTNVERGFQTILDLAIKNEISQKDMPKYLLVLSDMEFNPYSSGKTNFAQLKEKFENAQYELPKLVFWNLNARSENVPIRFDTNDTALVSGFSTNLLKSLLAAKDFNPQSIMLDTVMVDRYKLEAKIDNIKGKRIKP